MPVNADVDVVRRFYESFDGRPLEDSVARFLQFDVVWHVAGRNTLAGTFQGVPQVLAAMQAYADCSGGTLNLNTLTVLGDAGHVVAIHQATAWFPDHTYEAHEVDVFHLREGLIAEFWSFSEDQEATDRVWNAAAHGRFSQQ